MNPASTTSSDLPLLEPSRQRVVASLAAGMVGDREHRRVHARGLRPLETPRVRAARGHTHHLNPAGSAPDLLPVQRVEHRLEVRALAGDQYGEPERHRQAAVREGSRSTG